MTTVAPTTAYMRETAEEFLNAPPRSIPLRDYLASAKHLAHYVLALADDLERLQRAAHAVWGSTNSLGDETPDYWRQYGEEIPVVEINPGALADLGEALGIGIPP